MQAVRHGLRDALGVNENFRQPVGEAMRFAFERQDPGTLGRILARLRGVRHSCVTPPLRRAAR
jgi:hypothetical protein